MSGGPNLMMVDQSVAAVVHRMLRKSSEAMTVVCGWGALLPYCSIIQQIGRAHV